MSSEPQPLKKFGQHFLSNPYRLQLMLDEISPTANESFVEIGPGTGALTFPLSKLCKLIISLEVDDRMLRFLKGNIQASIKGDIQTGVGQHPTNIQLVKSDALKDDIGAILEDNLNKVSLQNDLDKDGDTDIDADIDVRQLRLVGNLPYNISVHLIEKFLLLSCFGMNDAKDKKAPVEKDSRGKSSEGKSSEGKYSREKDQQPNSIFNYTFSDMHFLVQKEIAQRLFAKVGDSDYGRLSIMMSVLASGYKLFNLPPGDFSPPPKVTSSFIQMQPQLHSSFSKSKSGLNKVRQFNKLITAAFSRPNRRMRNNLKNYPNTMDALIQLKLADQRAKETTSEEFLSIIDNNDLSQDFNPKD